MACIYWSKRMVENTGDWIIDLLGNVKPLR
jgi:hypothetical protein